MLRGQEFDSLKLFSVEPAIIKICSVLAVGGNGFYTKQVFARLIGVAPVLDVPSE